MAAFMMRRMLEVMNLSASTTTAGLSTRRCDTRTSPTLSPSVSLSHCARAFAASSDKRAFLLRAEVQFRLFRQAQRLAVKFVQMFHHELVPRIIQEQHLPFALAENLEIRAGFRRRAIGGQQAINLLLVGRHALHVIRQRRELARRRAWTTRSGCSLPSASLCVKSVTMPSLRKR